MLCRIGIILIMLGLALGDSEKIIVPIGVIALGLALVRIGGVVDASSED